MMIRSKGQIRFWKKKSSVCRFGLHDLFDILLIFLVFSRFGSQLKPSRGKCAGGHPQEYPNQIFAKKDPRLIITFVCLYIVLRQTKMSFYTFTFEVKNSLSFHLLTVTLIKVAFFIKFLVIMILAKVLRAKGFVTVWTVC